MVEGMGFEMFFFPSFVGIKVDFVFLVELSGINRGDRIVRNDLTKETSESRGVVVMAGFGQTKVPLLLPIHEAKSCGCFDCCCINGAIDCSQLFERLDAFQIGTEKADGIDLLISRIHAFDPCHEIISKRKI